MVDGYEPIAQRPAQLAEAVRLANAAFEQLEAAIDATEPDSDLELQLQEGLNDLRSAIAYMTAVPEVEYLGQRLHGQPV